MAEPKWKPCAFCGEDPRYSTRQDESLFSHAIVTWHHVSCPSCDVCMNHESLDAIAAAWNDRPDPDPDAIISAIPTLSAADVLRVREALPRVAGGWEPDPRAGGAAVITPTTAEVRRLIGEASAALAESIATDDGKGRARREGR